MKITQYQLGSWSEKLRPVQALQLTFIHYNRCVEPEFSTIGAMFGAASIVTGMIAGIGFSYLMPVLISTPGRYILIGGIRRREKSPNGKSPTDGKS